MPEFVEIIALGAYDSSLPKSIKVHSSPVCWSKNGGASHSFVWNRSFVMNKSE